jgi:transposase-like protein
MSKSPKFTEEQKVEVVLELLAGKLSHAEICRKYGISSTYAYKLKDKAVELLRQGIGHPLAKGDAQVEQLQKRIEQLEQLAGDQALAIRALKKTKESGKRW